MKKGVVFPAISIFVFMLILLYFLPAFALTPEIISIDPDHGPANSTTITIHGNNFESLPKVAFYGGGPYLVGSVDTSDSAKDVFVSGNYAYVADGYSGFQVIDISNPTNPTIVGSADTPGSAHGVYVSGSYAYVADWGSGLQVVDVSNPANSIVGSADAVYVNGVFVSGNYAYVTADDVAADNSGLKVVDVSNPANPTIVGSSDTPGNPSKVFVSGSYVYVADTDSGLTVLRAFEPCTDVTLVDSSTVTATVPAGLTKGTYNVYVVNPGGEQATLQNGFTVSNNGGDGNSGDGICFITTAAYGSRLTAEARVLTSLRDKVLMSSTVGRAFVKLYYKLSPPVADFIAKHNTARAVVRWSLSPVVGISWIVLQLGLIPTVVLILVLFALATVAIRSRSKIRYR